MNLTRSLLLASSLLVVLTGCNSADEPVVSAPSVEESKPAAVLNAAIGDLEIRGAHAMILPAVGAVYFEVVNHSDVADRLVGLETSSASAAETHESIDDEGVMRMKPRPEGFEVPANGNLVLEPSGKHVMLIEPDSSIEDRVQLTLRFENAGDVDLEIAVDGAGDDGHAGMDHGSMDHGSMEHGPMEHGSMEHSEMDHGSMNHDATSGAETESTESH